MEMTYVDMWFCEEFFVGHVSEAGSYRSSEKEKEVKR
jgi:hypothetical protein